MRPTANIEVDNMPADLLAGHDAQLEAAVAVLLDQIKVKAPGYPAPPPLLPPYPRSGMVPPQP
jgi:tricorn protease